LVVSPEVRRRGVRGVGCGYLLGLVDEGHGFLGEVAAFADGPVVVLFEQDGANEADR
jgi:hypothetical protein